MPTPQASSKTMSYKSSESRMTGRRPTTARDGSGGGGFGGPAMTVGVAPLTAWMRVSEEASRFASRRMEKNFETARALSRCTSPMEMWAAWTEAAQMMARDYAEGITRMGETYVDAASAARNDMAEAARARMEGSAEASV